MLSLQSLSVWAGECQPPACVYITWVYHNAKQATDITCIEYVASSVSSSHLWCLDVSPPLGLRCWAASPVHHLHADNPLHARLPHRHRWAPWIILFSPTIGTVPVPLVVLGCLCFTSSTVVLIGLVRLNRRQCNHALAVRIL